MLGINCHLLGCMYACLLAYIDLTAYLLTCLYPPLPLAAFGCLPASRPTCLLAYWTVYSVAYLPYVSQVPYVPCLSSTSLRRQMNNKRHILYDLDMYM